MRIRLTQRKPVETILAFGESINDSRSLAILIRGLRPELCPVRPIEEPTILRRDATKQKKMARSEQIARLVKAEFLLGRVVRGVVAHRDLDTIEPDLNENDFSLNGSGKNSSELEQDIRTSITKLQLDIKILPVVIAFELEAWWFMWPEALTAYRPSWNSPPNYSGRRVDMIQDAKEKLRNALRPKTKNGSIIDYCESDCPGIAKKVIEKNLVSHPKGISISFRRFQKEVARL